MEAAAADASCSAVARTLEGTVTATVDVRAPWRRGDCQRPSAEIDDQAKFFFLSRKRQGASESIPS